MQVILNKEIKMKLNVNLGDNSYDIVIEKGILQKASEHFDLERKVLIVTDTGVPKEYSEKIAHQCKESYIHTIKQGESSKNFENYKEVLSDLINHSFTRTDCIVAVGGGVVGDLAGFAASSYMRGIDFYNIPTTFLSMVDSSVGGKVAIDFEGYKNIIGAFYQPKGVLIDPSVLKTLDKRQLHSGIAESIKMSVTSDKKLFDILENTTDLNNDIETIIEKSLRVKIDVVEKDPKEKGLRRVLNFGHTIGHAIESKNGLDSYLHGECVAMGMVPMCSQKIRQRVIKVLKKYSLPTSFEESFDDIFPYLKHDKKATENKINIVVCDDIGSFEIMKVEIGELRKYMER